ncbi:MAG: CrcB family protein [Actinomyces sp.]|uniref:FluC/FEX family fluoride channel n=1 Tax=Actinomyces sp. TaxID=29317 RepID=UPI0026DB8DB7|nr:CrcB family protein [Actinomyces sp.]MDO4242728.1 CrcB family protein [Actinomyces sp.]
MSSDPRASLAAVGAGGAVGTLLRAAAEAAWPTAPGHLPATTLGINLAGAFCLGLLTGAWAGQGSTRTLRLALGTGLMGGLTTHSTYILEAHGLLAGGSPALGAAYLLGSALAGLLAAALGLVLGGRLWGREEQTQGPR